MQDPLRKPGSTSGASAPKPKLDDISATDFGCTTDQSRPLRPLSRPHRSRPRSGDEASSVPRQTIPGRLLDHCLFPPRTPLGLLHLPRVIAHCAHQGGVLVCSGVHDHHAPLGRRRPCAPFENLYDLTTENKSFRVFMFFVSFMFFCVCSGVFVFFSLF